jgi:hypothetical protein
MLSAWGQQKMVAAAADLVTTRCERVGQVVLVRVRRPDPPEREIRARAAERLSEWGRQEEGGGGGSL